MNPEIEAILGAYQRRLNDITAQAIAYEAKIQVLQAQIQQLQEQSAEQPTKKTTRKNSDAGEF